MKNVIKKLMYEVLGNTNILKNKLEFKRQKDSNRQIIFNTAMNTDNLGDYIIMRYCYDFIEEVSKKKGFIEISTHCIPNEKEIDCIKNTKYKFVCGTNLLTSHIEEWWNWRLPDGYRGKKQIRNVILLGTGWGIYQDKCSDYTKLIYKTMLNPNILHSVRDQYTEDKFKEIGIYNVINTGCPTMWRLTPEFCESIPNEKAINVITTITDYRRDQVSDNLMLEILSKHYRTVYIWIQGKKDEEYMESLKLPQNLVVIPRSLEAYEEILNQGNVDFVGTRLHAGIFALNHRIRSLIIAVDNRAVEIAKDTNLPVILREQIRQELEKRILSVEPIKINIKEENIKKFKEQFEV